MDRFKQYIDDVLTGKVTTGKLVQLAVKRHLSDLKKQNTEDFPFYFDEDEAMKHIKFFELCRHWKGSKAGQKIVAEPCQWFYIGSLHGWRNANNGLRRFHTVVKMVGRKNTKTTEAAITGLDHLLFHSKQSAQIYAGATKNEQALIVVNDAGKIVQQTPQLQEYFRLFKFRDKIARVVTNDLNSMFTSLGADSSTLDGFDPSMGIIDEYHAHDDDSIYNIIESGMGNRPDWLMVVITTAGGNKYGPCYSVTRKAAINTLKGIQVDDHSFYLIYEMDDDDNWEDQANWVKANPMLNVSVDLENYLIPRYQKAKIMGGEKESDFKTKNLNMWLSRYDSWIDDDTWMLCDKGGEMDDMIGQPCYAGLDLAATRDFNAFVLLFDKGEVVPFFWIPRDQVEKRTEKIDVDLATWARKGYIRICGDHAIDRDKQVQDLAEICQKYKVRTIGLDPYMSDEVMPKLRNAGITIPVRLVKQTLEVLGHPTWKLGEMVYQKQLNHYGNPILRWMMSNVAVYRGPNDNMRINKNKSTDKIDGVAALINAIAEMLTGPVQIESIYKSRGVISID